MQLHALRPEVGVHIRTWTILVTPTLDPAHKTDIS